MTVWGGDDFGGTPLGDGARYNPSTNTWTALAASGQPLSGSGATGVWAGSDLLIWGGQNVDAYTNTGARYTPATPP